MHLIYPKYSDRLPNWTSQNRIYTVCYSSSGFWHKKCNCSMFRNMIRKYVLILKIKTACPSVIVDCIYIATCTLCVTILNTSRRHAYVSLTPLKPHFYMYIVKLGFTGVNIIFLISAQKHRLWVLVRTASPRRFELDPQIYVFSRNMKNIRVFLIENFQFWKWNFLYVWIGVFS